MQTCAESLEAAMPALETEFLQRYMRAFEGRTLAPGSYIACAIGRMLELRDVDTVYLSLDQWKDSPLAIERDRWVALKRVEYVFEGWGIERIQMVERSTNSISYHESQAGTNLRLTFLCSDATSLTLDQRKELIYLACRAELKEREIEQSELALVRLGIINVIEEQLEEIEEEEEWATVSVPV